MTRSASHNKRPPDLRRYAHLSLAAALGTLGLKFGAYWLTNSVALLSDALETFANLAGALIALWALWLSRIPEDDNHAYGHSKAEYFAAGAEGGLICFAAVSIAVEAAHRLLSPAPVAQLGSGLVLSFVAAAVNFGVARVLLGAAHRHHSITLEADARHLLTDVWTTAVIGAGLLVLLFVPTLRLLDSLMALGVAAHIAVEGFGLLRKAFDGLMDRALTRREIDDIRAAVAPVLGSWRGAAVKDMRTRRSGAVRFVDITVAVDGAMTVHEAHAKCDVMERAIEALFAGQTDVHIHVEPRDEGKRLPS